MIENKLKRLLQSGGTAIGTMICDARTPAIARALAVAGFDYFILDTEHGSYSLETVSDMMQMARLEGITPIVRVPDFSYPFIARTLDAGALGVMVPRVKTRAQVEQVVAAAKYPPMGERGMMNARTNTDYRGMTIGEYGTWANAETIVNVQVETQEFVRRLASVHVNPPSFEISTSATSPPYTPYFSQNVRTGKVAPDRSTGCFNSSAAFSLAT